jgi:hypothetical protein
MVKGVKHHILAAGIAIFVLNLSEAASKDLTGKEYLAMCDAKGTDPAMLGDCLGYTKGIYDATRVLSNILRGTCLKEDQDTFMKVGAMSELIKKQPEATQEEFIAPFIIGAFLRNYRCESKKR